MNREPIALYIFRFTLGLGLFAFMAMLYWSSLLLESDIKEIKGLLSDIKETSIENQLNLKNLQSRIEHGAIHKNLSSRCIQKQDEKISFYQKKNENASIQNSKDNLLKDDPFYQKTLPNLLGNNFNPKGSLRTASIGRPENLHPFNGFREVANMIGLCSVSVAAAEFGKFETLAPEMALKVEEKKEGERLEYWIYLRDDVYWQALEQKHFGDDLQLAEHFLKKHPVTAEDFKLYYDAIMNPHIELPGAVSMRNYLSDIEEFHIVDPYTFVLRWKVQKQEKNGHVEHRAKYSARTLTGHLTPLASFVYKYFPDGSKIIENESINSYQNHSVWAQNFSEHWAKNIIVSCGPWIFDGINEKRARFRRNDDFFNPHAALCEHRDIIFHETSEAIWQDFKAGKIDLYELAPKQTTELENFLKSEEYLSQEKQGKGIEKIDYVSRAYTYVGWNHSNPLFKNESTRKALTLAINRERIIEQNLNGLGVNITGPFSPHSPSYNTDLEIIPFDPIKAKQILAQEGWFDSDGDGIIDKEIDGKRVPFSFSLTYYIKNPVTKINCEYIATALKEIGIACQLQGVDIADLSNSFDEKSFDAIYLGWALGSPPEEPKQLWHSSGAQEKGSSNAVGFENQEADQIIEELQYSYDKNKRQELYHRFHSIIYEKAPYTFLYAPKTVLLYRSYVKGVFIPAKRQDLIPGANIPEPSSQVFWIEEPQSLHWTGS